VLTSRMLYAFQGDNCMNRFYLSGNFACLFKLET
jgi:hypothetical protein